MAFWQGVKRRVRGIILPVFFSAIAIYFGFSAAQGNHGLVVSAQLQEQLTQAQKDNAQARQDLAALEHRVGGLRNRHIDPDTLDERAREKLGRAEPNEVVVQYGEKDKLF